MTFIRLLDESNTNEVQFSGARFSRNLRILFFAGAISVVGAAVPHSGSNPFGATSAYAASLDLSQPAFANYDTLVEEWGTTLAALETAKSTKADQANINEKVRVDIAGQTAKIDITKKALNVAVLNVAESKQELSAVDQSEDDPTGDQLSAELQIAQSALDQVIANTGAAETDITRLTDEYQRIGSTVTELKKAVSAARAAESASKVVVEAVKSAQLAIAKNDYQSSNEETGATLEDDFLNEAVEQAEAAEKSAEIAQKALTLTEDRLRSTGNNLDGRKADLSASKKSEEKAYDLFATADKSFRAHATKRDEELRKTKALVQKITDELTAAQTRLDEQKNILQQQTIALQELHAILDAGIEMSENLDADVTTADTEFNAAETELRAAQRTKSTEIAAYMADLNADLRDRLRALREGQLAVSDRYVVASASLFPGGSSKLRNSGVEKLNALTAAVKELTAEIPEQVDWVVRVDSYAGNSAKRSQHQLSQARALTLANLLIQSAELPVERISASGIGKSASLAPISAGDVSTGWVEVVLTAR